MGLDISAIRSAADMPQKEASLGYEELAVLAACTLISDTDGYFVGKDRYVKWSYNALLQYMFSDLYFGGLAHDVDKVRLILDASLAAGFHEIDRRSKHLIRLTPPREAEALIRQPKLFQKRQADLLAALRKKPVLAVFRGLSESAVPASVSEIVRICVHLSPDERLIVRWMALAFDSPIMELMTQFGYMAEERRRTITSLLGSPERLANLRDDRTYRKFVDRYMALTISNEDRAFLIAIGRSDRLADLGRRIVRLSRDRRQMIAQML